MTATCTLSEALAQASSSQLGKIATRTGIASSMLRYRWTSERSTAGVAPWIRREIGDVLGVEIRGAAGR